MRMRKTSSFFVVWLCLSLAAAADPTNTKSNTKSKFVKFYAPWCGHCKKLAPTWQQLTDKVNDNPNNQVTIDKVDCTIEENKPVCESNGVRGYPTLLYFPAGSNVPEKYQGGRSIKALLGFLFSKGVIVLTEDDVLEFGTAEDISKVLEKEGPLSTQELMRNIATSAAVVVAVLFIFCGGCFRKTIVSSPSTSTTTTALATVNRLIQQHDVVVFSKTWCPYCTKVKNLFKDLNRPCHVVELDTRPDGDAIQAALLRKTKQKTVPNVFIDKQWIGGCDDTHAHFNK